MNYNIPNNRFSIADFILSVENSFFILLKRLV